jgi:membrane-associated phospholipid phosphatase
MFDASVAHPDPPGTLHLTRAEEAMRLLRRGFRALWWVVPVLVLLIMYVDRPVAESWHDAQDKPAYAFFNAADELGEGDWYILPGLCLALGMGLAGSAHWRKPLYVAVSVIVSGIAVNLIKAFLGRYRPVRYFENGDYGFNFLELSASMRSFPSGHTTTAFAVAVALGLLFPRTRILWWSVAGLVGLGRIATGAHFPSDVVAGAWLGTVTAMVLSVYFTRKSSGRYA